MKVTATLDPPGPAETRDERSGADGEDLRRSSAPRRARRFHGRRGGLLKSYRVRIIAGALAVSLPVLGMMVFVLSSQAASSLKRSTGEALIAEADRGEDINAWLGERRENAGVLASLLEGGLDRASVLHVLGVQADAANDYDVIEVVSPSGEVLLSSDEQKAFDPSGLGWFDLASQGSPITSPVYRQGDALHFVVAQPVHGTGGEVTEVVIEDLSLPAILPFIDADFARSGEVFIVDEQGRLVLSSTMAELGDDAALIAAGALQEAGRGPAATAAADGKTGSITYSVDGADVFAGYQPGPDGLGWGVVAHQDASEALVLAARLRKTGLMLLLIGIAMQLLFATAFAGREVRRMRRIIRGSLTASETVSARSSALSASSAELASTTTEQSAAVTETSATMEELARTSASIADTVDRISSQASDTRENLEVAEADIQASSERTLVLTQRVNEIGALLTLINEIADQTNLLALNAAIEAARAGEGGQGFAVVADEVRRLAERSKNSAADIAKIIESTRDETHATVMAMEKGAKQMQLGLVLLEQVAEATAQISLTTQQQRSATDQVVETMEQLASANRQISAAAQDIAGASGELNGLAASLEKQSVEASKQF